MSTQPDLPAAADAPAPLPAPCSLPLSTVPEILAAMDAAGIEFKSRAGLLVRDGEGRCELNKRPDEALWAAMGAHKAELMAACEARALAEWGRAYRCPADDEAVGLYAQKTRLTHRYRQLIEDYMCRQAEATLRDHAPALVRWLEARAAVYEQHAVETREAQIRAALDLICWQRRLTDPRRALDWLDDLETTALGKR